MIISYIDGRNELSILSRTSKRFRDLVEGKLYDCLDITARSGIKLDARRRNLLLRALLSPRVANLVTTFRIGLPWCNRKSSIWPKLPLLGNGCDCSDLDDRLGNALGVLPSLRALQIDCSLCRDSEDIRHLYLTKLAAINLQELRLSCQCTTGSNKSQRILSSPCFDSITTLQWIIAGISSTIPISPQQTRDVLPLVNKLSYDDNSIFDQMISHRHITHLGCHTMKTNLHEAIRANEGILVHIRMGDGCFNFIRFLRIDSQPYRNVRHVGCFYFGLYEVRPFRDQLRSVAELLVKVDKILRYMLPFTALRQLESIEVSSQRNRRPNAESFDSTGSEVWDEALLFELQRQHHKLKRVFLKVVLQMSKLTGETCDFFLWKREQSWYKHEIAPFTAWDMEIGLEPRILL